MYLLVQFRYKISKPSQIMFWFKILTLGELLVLMRREAQLPVPAAILDHVTSGSGGHLDHVTSGDVTSGGNDLISTGCHVIQDGRRKLKSRDPRWPPEPEVAPHASCTPKTQYILLACNLCDVKNERWRQLIFASRKYELSPSFSFDNVTYVTRANVIHNLVEISTPASRFAPVI